MEHVKQETLRYLGYGNQEADQRVAELVEECLEELYGAAAMRSVWFEYPLTLKEDGLIVCPAFQTKSRSLRRNLKDCESLLLFAATLGAGVDQLIHKYTVLSMSKAVVLQAGAAAVTEEYCDSVNGVLKREYEEKGLFLRPRFSPGYGDFPLECQTGITAALQTGKRIGLNLTDSLIMTPTKSVTAVIGISKKPGNCDIRGCGVCGKTDCAYRRG